MNKNIYINCINKKYDIDYVLLNISCLYSTKNTGYNFHLITSQNLNKFTDNLSLNIDELSPVYKWYYIKISLLNKNGGIWMDNNILQLNAINSYFDIIDKYDGFFIKNNEFISDSIIGSKANTKLMTKLVNCFEGKVIRNKLKMDDINYTFLNTLYKSHEKLFSSYLIINQNNMFFENVKIVNDVDFIILNNNIIVKTENNKTDYMFNDELILLKKYIDKAFQNMNHLIDYDFIEIGTSNFGTIIQKCDENAVGLSIDIIKYYLDCLPNKKNVKKLNIGISDSFGLVKTFHIPEKKIKKYKLLPGLKGCNTINKFHPYHIKYNVKHLVEINKINIIPINTLLYSNKCNKIKILKMDTEGHDCIIMDALYKYLKYLPQIMYPKKIIFESNENAKPQHVINIINKYCKLGYILISSKYDTILKIL